LAPITTAITFMPYQFALGISAVRAVYREVTGQQDWEKTAHVGAHRQPEILWSVAFQRLLDEAGAHLTVEQGSVLVLDPLAKTFSLLASHGTPLSSVEMARLDPVSVTQWITRTRQPAKFDRWSLPSELEGIVTLPDVRSALVLPFAYPNAAIGVLSVATSATTLDEAGMRWLSDRLHQVVASSRAVPAARAS
jgi:hypothetical protein